MSLTQAFAAGSQAGSAAASSTAAVAETRIVPAAQGERKPIKKAGAKAEAKLKAKPKATPVARGRTTKKP